MITALYGSHLQIRSPFSLYHQVLQQARTIRYVCVHNYCSGFVIHYQTEFSRTGNNDISCVTISPSLLMVLTSSISTYHHVLQHRRIFRMLPAVPLGGRFSMLTVYLVHQWIVQRLPYSFTHVDHLTSCQVSTITLRTDTSLSFTS